MNANATKTKPVSKTTKSHDLSSQVLSVLGTPKDLFKVESKHLYGNVYRVNVRVKNTSNSLVTVTSIPHSYHVITNDNGDIVKSEPPLEPAY